MHLTRRRALLGLAATVTLGGQSLALAAAATERRFVVVLLRGALDGLAAVPPYGDSNLARLRAELTPPAPGKPGGLLDLGGFFGLHPDLAGLHALYTRNELLIAHAIAGDWRSRSHFDAQDFLESGADHRLTSGWLNRVVAALPASPPGGSVASGGGGGGGGSGGSEAAIAIGPGVPLILRGDAPVGSWAPQNLPRPSVDLYAQIAALNAGDPLTGPALANGLRERGFTTEVLAGTQPPKNPGAFPALAGVAGKLLAAAGGPRIAAMELGGWDTHAAQAGRLADPLRQLDAGMMALQSALGEAWTQTVVLVMTEFGRTVRVNGTKGTDHGTGTVAFALGGAVSGGRVRADWPGLGDGHLFEARDLAPTADLRAFAKGLIGPHLGLDENALTQVFPGSDQVRATAGLVRVS